MFHNQISKYDHGGNFQQQYKVKHSSKKQFYTKHRSFYTIRSIVYWLLLCLSTEGRHPSEGMKNVCWTNISLHIITQIKKHIISTRNTSELRNTITESCFYILFILGFLNQYVPWYFIIDKNSNILAYVFN